jgi:tryptophanase
MTFPFAEPYKIKSIETLHRTTREERVAAIEKANFNLFKLASRDVFVDLLTDSGTGAMSDRQWGAIMTGDESYAGARSFEELREAIRTILGFPHVLPTHQGRAAENVLFSVLIKEGNIVPGNSHFDTTKGHIEFRRAKAVDCTIDEAFDPTLDHPFKGNLDLGKLENVLSAHPREQIPLVIVTMTCNSGGGQPVSLENLAAVSKLCRRFGVPLFIDGARFAENAYFIKVREPGYADKTVKEIVLEIMSHVDGMTMSSKKDAIVNMGGFIAMRDAELYRQASTFNIMFEGYLTYGGMSGRDMAALAVGLDEGTAAPYLESRIRQVRFLGEEIKRHGVPIMEPIGGHAVFVDAKRFFPHIPQSQYPAQLLGVELFIEGGVRGVEIGTLLADRDPETRENRYPEREMLRLAVPRRTYTDNHMAYTAAALGAVWKRRSEIRSGFEITWEAPIMRHFTVDLKRI